MASLRDNDRSIRQSVVRTVSHTKYFAVHEPVKYFMSKRTVLSTSVLIKQVSVNLLSFFQLELKILFSSSIGQIRWVFTVQANIWPDLSFLVAGSS